MMLHKQATILKTFADLRWGKDHFRNGRNIQYFPYFIFSHIIPKIRDMEAESHNWSFISWWIFGKQNWRCGISQTLSVW